MTAGYEVFVVDAEPRSVEGTRWPAAAQGAGGTLDIMARMGYTPSVGNVTLISDLGGTIGGTFVTTDLPTESGYTFMVVNNGTTLTLDVTTFGGGGSVCGTPEPSTWTMRDLGFVAAFVAMKNRRNARVSR